MANTKQAKAYLKEFKKAKKAGKLKGFPTYGQWKKRKKIKSMGGSRQMKEQMAGLSKSDYEAVMKRFGKK